MIDQPVPALEAICGHCIAWHPVEMKGPVTIGQPKRGVCKGLPATPVPQYDARGNTIGQRDMFPCPVETDSCLLFTPRPLI